MPIADQDYWVKRFPLGSPCWSADHWVDVEHGFVARHAVRRVIPRTAFGLMSVLDVGCGDGQFTRWMAQEFHHHVTGTDALPWPGVQDLVPFVQADAEMLHLDLGLSVTKWWMITFINSLGYMSNWRAAVASAVSLRPKYLLAFDQFMTPTPEFWKGQAYRRPIEYPELVDQFHTLGYEVEKAIGADLLGRRLFLSTPKWTHPAVAYGSAAFDLLASYVLSPERARHSAVLFRRAPS